MKVLVVSSDRTSSDGHAINLGDALLTDSLVSALQAQGLIVEAVDLGGRRRFQEEPRTYVHGLRGLWRAIRRSDAVVVGGGTLLQDDVGRGFGGLPRLMCVTSTICRVLGKPALFFGVGCDPVERRVARLLLRFAVLGRSVWVRDEASLGRCRALGCSDVRLAADVSLLAANTFTPPVEGGKRRVILALARGDGRTLQQRHLAALQRASDEVIFVQMDQGDHSRDISLISEDSKAQFDAVTYGISWREAADVYARGSVVVASRMHALYLGMMLGRQLVGFGTLPKVLAFCEEFGVVRATDMEAAVAQGAPKLADPAAFERARRRVDIALSELVEALRRG